MGTLKAIETEMDIAETWEFFICKVKGKSLWMYFQLASFMSHPQALCQHQRQELSLNHNEILVPGRSYKEQKVSLSTWGEHRAHQSHDNASSERQGVRRTTALSGESVPQHRDSTVPPYQWTCPSAQRLHKDVTSVWFVGSSRPGYLVPSANGVLVG